VFVRQEWRRVVLAHGLETEQAYLEACRRGRGVRLAPRDRRALWRTFDAFRAALANEGATIVLRVADSAAGLLNASGRTLYRHVLVDEAQDLHPAHWRLCAQRSSAPPTTCSSSATPTSESTSTA